MLHNSLCIVISLIVHVYFSMLTTGPVLLAGLVLLQCLHFSATFNDWWQQPYGDNSFNKKAKFDTNTTLNCDDDRVGSLPLEVLYWILPDLTVLEKGKTRTFLVLGGYAGWSVSAQANAIQLIFIQPQHFGFYYCVLIDGTTNQKYVVKKAVNYDGPHFGDTWEMYEMNVIIGVSSAGGFLVVAFMVYFVYSHQYRENEMEDNDDDSSNKNTYVGLEDAPPGENQDEQKMALGAMQFSEKGAAYAEALPVYDNQAFTTSEEKQEEIFKPAADINVAENGESVLSPDAYTHAYEYTPAANYPHDAENVITTEL